MALFGLVWVRAQWITADWARDRRHSGVTLVMATSFLVAWGIPAQQKSTKSDHTWVRTWVVAATSRRPGH